MKQKLFISVIIIFIVANLYPYGNNRRGNGDWIISDTIGTLPYEELSAMEKESLMKMREEEKLARDVYRVMYEKWGLKTFYNISQAEQQHMDAVKALIDKYGLTDPVIDDATGVFADPELLNLFNQLIEKGSISLSEALLVGATIEDLDIYDLQNCSLKIDNMDMLFVFGNLKKGSENHMRAFVKQLNNFNIEYKAQYITQEELETILESAGNGRGRWN